ncbi:MAG: creatininase family protein, partial [Candidatus Latescibacteria bacterium]|nr:creatininase family protein [Candidatus Latescibacterota bacterium]
ERKFRIEALRSGLAWTQRDWLQATADTGVGNPAAATAEKGRRCLEALGRKLGAFLTELAAANPEDLYEKG